MEIANTQDGTLETGSPHMSSVLIKPQGPKLKRNTAVILFASSRTLRAAFLAVFEQVPPHAFSSSSIPAACRVITRCAPTAFAIMMENEHAISEKKICVRASGSQEVREATKSRKEAKVQVQSSL
jgi:hypothetical protein